MDDNKTCDCKNPRHHKKWPIKLLAIALTIFVIVKIFSGIRAYHYIGETNGPATITVSGKGEVIATPDIATFDFSVSNEAASVGDAQTQTTKKMNDAIAFLKQNGVAAADIKTTDYSIYPQYNYTQTPVSPLNGTVMSNQVLVGYNVSESVEVKVRTLSSAGTLLSGIGEFGVTNVSGLTFTEDKVDDLAKQAEASAIADARTNADTLAKNLGVKLVRIVSYSNQNPTPIYYAAMSSMADKAAAPQIEAGQNTITSNVSVVYEVR